MDGRIGIALPLATSLLVASCIATPPPDPQSDIASLVPSPTEFGPHIGRVVEAALEAAKDAPNSPSTVARLGMVLHAYDKVEAAARCYERALDLQPNRFEWLYYLGLIKAKTGQYDEALSALRLAIQIDPSYAPARLKMADVLLATGKAEQSRVLYAELAHENPSLAQAAYGLGRSLAELEQPAAAVEQLTRTIELAPEFGAAHYALGLAYRDLGDEAAARHHVAQSERIAGRQPPLDDPLMRDVNALQTDPRSRELQAYRLQVAGKLPESIAQYEQALASDPDLIKANLNLISLYTRIGNLTRAEQHYRRVMSLNPNIADAHYNYAVLKFHMGEGAESEAALLRALEINPAHYDARFNLGALYEAQGRSREAIREYELTLTHQPTGVGARIRLGRLLLQLGEVTQGLASIEAGLTPESSETPGFMYELAIAHARLGRSEEATRWFERAHQLAIAYDLPDLITAIEEGRLLTR